MELVDRLYKQLELLSQHKDFNESCTIIVILDAINKIKELEAKLAECEKDAKMWQAVGFSVEQAIINGCCAYDIETAYEQAMADKG